MRRMATWCLIFSLLLSIAPATSAKPQNDWSNLKNFTGQVIAINSVDGATMFGFLIDIDDSQITIQLADDERMSAQERTFKRAEVVKVWRAKFRFGDDNTGKGALIGVGVGLGAGYVTALVLAQRDSGPPHGVALFPIVGAVVGAKVGASKPKGHKKQKLIYSI